MFDKLIDSKRDPFQDSNYNNSNYQEKKKNLSLGDDVIAVWECEIIEVQKNKVVVRVVDKDNLQNGTSLYEISKDSLKKMGIAECEIGDLFNWTFYEKEVGVYDSKITRRFSKTKKYSDIINFLTNDLEEQKKDILEYMRQNG